MSAASQQTTRLTGGRLLAEMLRLHQVGPMFGIGGFQLLPFYEAIRALGLRHHLVNDERTGAFAADAYARISGRPGVCDATLGPGATNLVTALVESLNAGTPVIAIIGDAHRRYAGRNMTQEARQVDILRPAVKDLIRVEAIERIPELVRRAFSVATSGRPGPVVIDAPEDICHGEAAIPLADLWADPRTFTYPALRCRPDADAVAQAAALLERAERPLILAGGGVHISGAQTRLTEFAEAFSAPVAHTMSGKGAIACVHPLSAGLFGRYSRIANDLIAAADCLLVVGCKLGEIATRRYALIKPETPLIHLESCAEEIGRTSHADVALWGDAAAGLADLHAAMAASAPAQRRRRAAYVEQTRARMAQWRVAARGRAESDERPINVARLVQELNRALPEDGVLIADGGFAAHWTGLFFDARRAGRCYVADRGLASIGYGLPGALGAKLAAPERPVVALTGDAGLNMTIGDLETARRAGVGFVLCVVNNAASGYVKALQHSLYGAGSYQSCDLEETDYAAVARAMGCTGVRIEDPAQLGPRLRQAFDDATRPNVLDIVTTRDPAAMLPGTDARALTTKPGDRPI